MIFLDKDFEEEIHFKTSRSSGKGGQHVNKTESRVSLLFNIATTKLLNESEKELIQAFSGIQISKDGVWQIDVDDSRSQVQNKKLAFIRFKKLLTKALTKSKPRKKSRPSKASILKRLKSKAIQAEKKKNRAKDF